MILMHLLILLPIQMSLVYVKNSKHLTFQARAISGDTTMIFTEFKVKPLNFHNKSRVYLTPPVPAWT